MGLRIPGIFLAMPLEGLCSETEARWFYWGWSRVYDAMQPFFTSDSMRDAGLDMAGIDSATAPKILDVGAGTGTLSLNILRRVPNAEITLLDQSPEMLERARLKPALEGCAFELADAQVLPCARPFDPAAEPSLPASSDSMRAIVRQALPFDDDSFDCVVSSGSLYYYPRPVTALQEQLRVVRPGGVVLAMGSLQVGYPPTRSPVSHQLPPAVQLIRPTQLSSRHAHPHNANLRLVGSRSRCSSGWSPPRLTASPRRSSTWSGSPPPG